MRGVACIALALTVAACGREPAAVHDAQGPATDSEMPIPAEQAEALWTVRCASCHGAAGRGDTPHGQTVGAPDMFLPVWQRSVSDEHLRDVIRNGQRRAWHGRMTNMPSNPDLGPSEVEGLLALVRGRGAR